MGEVADMILDGTLCDQCGVFIGEAVGYPRSCSHTTKVQKVWTKKPKIQCSICKKWIKEAGYADHMKAVHNVVVK